MSEVRILAITNLPEIVPGDNLIELLSLSEPKIQEGDILVVTQKVVSKAEGRLFPLDNVQPSPRALEIARRWDKHPGLVELVLQESQELLRETHGVLISRTRQNFVCANAGIDLSNVDGGHTACLLPIDCDLSAKNISQGLTANLGFDIPVIISDSFGRPWRQGITNIALGSFGMEALLDHRGNLDQHGLEMKATVIHIADTIAAASELVVGKTLGYGAAILRDYPIEKSSSSNVQSTIRAWSDCFFT